MVTLLENNLENLDYNLYNRFRLIKKLLYYTAEQHQITISKEYLLKIITGYFSKNFEQLHKEEFLDEAYNFFEQMVELYENNNFSKYNFILEESSMNPLLKSWLKNEKENILNFFDFYLKNDSASFFKNIIIKNNYFEVLRIKSDEKEKLLVPYIEPNCILIRFMIRGKIYYSDGILLEDNFYIISEKNYIPKYAKILSDSIDLLIFVLKKEFIEDFDIVIPIETNIIRSNNYSKKIFEFLKMNFIEENPFAFLEILSYFFKANNFLKEQVFPFSENLIEANNSIMISSIIKENIKLPIEELINTLEKKLNLSSAKINILLLKNMDLTLKKVIIRLKIKYIIEEFYQTDSSIEELLINYNFTNMKQFRYNLHIFFNISIKDLKKIKSNCFQL